MATITYRDIIGAKRDYSIVFYSPQSLENEVQSLVNCGINVIRVSVK